MWLLYAFSGPVLWAISVHLDKYLVERFFKESSVAVMLLFTAWIGVLLLPFIWLFQPDAVAVPLGAMLVIGLAGILYMGAVFFYLQALQAEEASVVAPLFQASPLFAYVLGYVVLGERLSPLQMLGGLLIVGGGAMISARRGQSGGFKTRLVVLMLACALSIAISSVIFKVFAIRVDFWSTTFWLFVGEAIFGAALLAVPSYRRQFFDLLKVNTGPLLAINGSNELINLSGGLSVRYALMLAPLSLVQAIGSTTTVFVFLFGVALSLLSPKHGREDLSPASLVQKSVSAVLIAAGVTLING